MGAVVVDGAAPKGKCLTDTGKSTVLEDTCVGVAPVAWHGSVAMAATKYEVQYDSLSSYFFFNNLLT